MFLCQPNCVCILLMVVILSVWWQSSEAYVLHDEHYNPNRRCPGRNEVLKDDGQNCKHGAYVVKNPDPVNCADRYVCYVGLNEFCHQGDKCAYNAVCTSCGICQKCESSDDCSLCPTNLGKPVFEILKRLMQKRVFEYNMGELENENVIDMN